MSSRIYFCINSTSCGKDTLIRQVFPPKIANWSERKHSSVQTGPNEFDCHAFFGLMPPNSAFKRGDGEVAEWSKVPSWKGGERQRSAGSNPVLSATVQSDHARNRFCYQIQNLFYWGKLHSRNRWLFTTFQAAQFFVPIGRRTIL